MELTFLTLSVPLGGVIALFFAILLYFSIRRQSSGTEKMQELSNAIREGAMAFLNSEYKVLVIFAIVVAAILYAASFVPGSNMQQGLAVAFVIGAIFSAATGNIGMRIATLANAKLEPPFANLKNSCWVLEGGLGITISVRTSSSLRTFPKVV